MLTAHALEEQLTHSPNNVSILKELSILYYKKAQDNDDKKIVNRALELLTKAVALDSNDSEAIAYHSGILFMKARNSFLPNVKLRFLNQAIQQIDDLINREDDNLTARRVRGFSSFKMPVYMGRLDIAIQDFEYLARYEDDNPNSIEQSILARIYLHLGEAYLMRGKNQDAEKCWMQVEQIAPASNETEKARAFIKKHITSPSPR